MNERDRAIVDRFVGIEAKTLQDLTDMYCLRCRVGLYNCRMFARDCPRIRLDNNYNDEMKEWGEEK